MYYESEHYERVRTAVPECTVLLKSSGAFPLPKPCKVALYGNGARKTLKGGTGSGDVNVFRYTTVEQGLRSAGFTVTTDAWLDGYDTIWQKAHETFRAGLRETIEQKGIAAIMLAIGAIMPEPNYDLPLDGEGDVAIYVLSRISGEGSDRTAAPGDFSLTETEIRDILYLAAAYPKFLLVLNVGGVVDLSPVLAQVKDILLLSQPGMAVGDALADLLLGKAYPSGKLAATWAPLEDYPSAGHFGDPNNTCYPEGIYVGYRYFDTAEKEPLFPFGYGLGYTTFSIRMQKASVDGATISVASTVENTGSFAGKEVVQLYVSVPEQKLCQPKQVLAAFAKTPELRPGQRCTVTLDFDLRDLASYDEETSSAILEAGSYILRLGNSSRSLEVCAVAELDHPVLVQELSVVGSIAKLEELQFPKRSTLPPSPEIPKLSLCAASIPRRKAAAVQPDAAALDFVKGLTDEEVACLCIGEHQKEGGKSVIGAAGVHVAGSAGETTAHLTEKGIAPLIVADGPAGLRLNREYGIDEDGVYSLDLGSLQEIAQLMPEKLRAHIGFSAPQKERGGKHYRQACTAIPIGTALAQSWDPSIARDCGDIVGAEMETTGVHLWLAPALNIQRHPLCGRNFEYYSEDPLLSGKMAAAVAQGVQKHPGCGVTMKHFCCNNQETNRMHSNSILSQRALRDIYLKGFEIALREGKPAALMTSYNLLNGEHTSHLPELVQTVARCEWDYDGLIMTDWLTVNLQKPEDQYPGAIISGCIRAGNDLMMPGTAQNHADLLEALHDPHTKYPVDRNQLETCAAWVVQTVWKLASAHGPLVREELTE